MKPSALPATTIKDARISARQQLHAAGIDSAQLDADLLIGHVLNFTREQLLIADHALTLNEQARIDHVISRRAEREPVAYIIGQKEFWSLPFKVASGVLIPRPDTETIIESALKLFTKDTALNILDMGTGSGCILLSLLHEFPQAKGLGLDISSQALEIAGKNAADLGLANRASFLLSRWAETLSGMYDLIVSNPPYIEPSTILTLEPEVSIYEPKLALDGGTDGLEAYRQIAPCIKRHITPGGTIILEVGDKQAEAVATLLVEQQFKIHSFAKDLSGIDRCVIAKAAL